MRLFVRFSILLLLLCTLDRSLVFSQSVDTTFMEAIDSLEEIADDEAEINYNAPPDSAVLEARSFDNEKLESLKADPDMDYKQPPTIAESLWDRLWIWLTELINSIFNGAVYTNWGRVIVYVIGLVMLVVIIMMVLKVNAFKVLYSAEGSKVNSLVLDENIHEMNFDQLIQEATKSQDYRKGIRLLFLYALKLLSDKHLINWESGKTNHEYVNELQQKDLKIGLNELSFYFDYAWYGNFNISLDMFNKAQNLFSSWKAKIS